MTANIPSARETIRRCRALREDKKVEAVLRGEFLSGLRVIFPDPADAGWINHYVEGAEARTLIGTAGGTTADRFIDHLVGSTTIEYEADLRNTAKRDEGFHQVKEHVAGLIRSGVPVSQVRGVLSDTVEWHAYDVELRPGSDPERCGPDDVALHPVADLELTDDSAASAERLVQFVRRHLAREQSRPLRAEFLVLDVGLDSSTYERSARTLLSLVTKARAADTSIALATELWSRFVDHLVSKGGGFRADAYVDEVYLGILARLLTANVLAGQALASSDGELATILNGLHFRDRYQLENMVEQDYFGWLVRREYIAELVPIARSIQRDLHAYDFSRIYDDDMFGRLLAQLARRSQRKLLGQEWTPSWLGRLLAERCLDNLPKGEAPRIVDMCCGSGSILVEVLKAAKTKLGLSDIQSLRDVATGFDIDPLAVSLSKATWVVALGAEIKATSAPIVIPIYHADSLFLITPVSPELAEDKPIRVHLDGTIVEVPQVLVQPAYRELFDRIVDWAYDEALDAKAKGSADGLTPAHVEAFLSAAAKATGKAVPADLHGPLGAAVFALTRRMSELAVTNRNGIWAFILRNTYRPGLLSGQFNGLASNPPWLTMSGIADNPYRALLTSRARRYGIMPSGQSFLHLELGTTHLLHAVDRYLKVGASVACLVPGTIFNGTHHEPLRQRKFLDSQRPVALDIAEVWQVAPGTFKYPGAAIIGSKRAKTTGLKERKIAGSVATRAGLEKVDFSVATVGDERTAWLLKKEDKPAISPATVTIPEQGADLMPRSAVCVEILDGAEPEVRVDTPSRGSRWGFTVKASKELKNERFPGRVARQFIYRMAQSENLLPFVLGENCAPIAIPAIRTQDGSWQVLDDAGIRRMGFTQTARRFHEINQKLVGVGRGQSLQARIDERGKLLKQAFGDDGYVVLAGAGGKHICATCVRASDARELVIDQTLYWEVFADENEAWYRVGMLNSHAMTEATLPFNPKGDFGERHIHTLPYRLMPAFDPANDEHVRIAGLAREVAGICRELIAADPYLQDSNRALPARRRKLRDQLRPIPEFQELEDLCAAALGTTAFGGSMNPEDNGSVHDNSGPARGTS